MASSSALDVASAWGQWVRRRLKTHLMVFTTENAIRGPLRNSDGSWSSSRHATAFFAHLRSSASVDAIR